MMTNFRKSSTASLQNLENLLPPTFETSQFCNSQDRLIFANVRMEICQDENRD